jgi:hypothetical protein
VRQEYGAVDEAEGKPVEHRRPLAMLGLAALAGVAASVGTFDEGATRR